MLRFTKMHGLGNDYVYVNCFAEELGPMNPPTLARAMSDRHRGVGSDGLILICPPAHGVAADVRMEMYNADGSRGEMCGNGIRCVAKYAIDHGLVPSSFADTGDTRTISVQTDRGVLLLQAHLKRGRVDQVRVDMGRPILTPAEIPVDYPGDRCIRGELVVEGKPHLMTCVSMGNPHAVFFMETMDDVDLARFGPLVENHAAFPNRVNAHIVTIRSRSEVVMRTWERGSGLTQACGTGACAVVVAGVLEERLNPEVLVHLPGGDLNIHWAGATEQDGGTVFMTGPATEVFSGEWPL